MRPASRAPCGAPCGAPCHGTLTYFTWLTSVVDVSLRILTPKNLDNKFKWKTHWKRMKEACFGIFIESSIWCHRLQLLMLQECCISCHEIFNAHQSWAIGICHPVSSVRFSHNVEHIPLADKAGRCQKLPQMPWIRCQTCAFCPWWHRRWWHCTFHCYTDPQGSQWLGSSQSRPERHNVQSSKHNQKRTHTQRTKSRIFISSVNLQN